MYMYILESGNVLTEIEIGPSGGIPIVLMLGERVWQCVTTSWSIKNANNFMYITL